MTLLEKLETLGANTKEGLDRVMDDVDLYTMMLGMFVDSVEGDPVRTEEFDAADRDALIRKVHTLKGTTGNLSLQPLFEGYMEILTLLREEKPAQAKSMWLKVEPKQRAFIDCIKAYR